MSKTRPILIWIAGLAVALLSTSNAVGNVFQKRSPLLAIGSMPENGRAYAEAADFLLRQAIVDNKTELPDALPQDALSYSRRGFVSEPLAVEAPRIIALGLAQGGDRERARRLMKLIPPLSKRETAANVWLAEDAGLQGANAEMVQFLDLTLRSSPGARQVMLPRLVQLLQGEAERSILQEALAINPPWAGSFWSNAAVNADVSVGASILRREASVADQVSRSTDQRILSNLVETGNLLEAVDFYSFLANRAPSDGFSDQFSESQEFAPFDWEVLGDGAQGGALIPRDGVLQMYSVEPGRNVAARKLIPISGGTYTISGNLAYWRAGRNDEVFVRLRCGETNVGQFALAKNELVLEGRIELGQLSCQFAWLEVGLVVVDQPLSVAEVGINDLTMATSSRD